MTLRTARPDDLPQHFLSWRRYLSRWSRGADRSFCSTLTTIYSSVLDPEIDRLKHLLNEATASGADRADDAAAEYRDELAAAERRWGFPWVTPVLGSGCLTGDVQTDHLAARPARLAAAATNWAPLPDHTPAAEVVEAFAWAIIDSKLAARPQPPAAPEAPGEHDPLTARIVLAAQLITRLYHAVGQLGLVPIVSLTEDLEVPAADDDLVGRLVEPLLQQLAAIGDLLAEEDRDEHRFAQNFVATLTADLRRDKPRVRGSDAALLCEIAWSYLSSDTTQYPGWSHLLVQLTLASEGGDRHQRLPYLRNIRQARAALATQLRPATAESWNARVEGGSAHTRHHLYDAMADLLGAQAALHRSAAADQGDFPLAAAFVTSFDLELEMALLARRQSFLLIMPFYVLDGAGDNATALVWLQTVVEAPEAAERLRSDHLETLRTTRDWHLVTSEPAGSDDDWTLPVVVRLAGSPQVQVAGFTRDHEEPWATRLKSELGGEGIEVLSTVLLDEHTALQQWSADVAEPLVAQTTDHSSRRPTLGFPIRLVAGGQQTDARFWFVLGVQLADDAVRHRTAAVVGAADLRGADRKKPTARPQRAGVVVNRRTTSSQRDVFLWQNLDVVDAPYDHVLAALRHAVDHVRQPAMRRTGPDDCRLGAPA